MCRIAGMINPVLPLGELRNRVKAMCTMLQHGGPDDEGIYLHDDAHVCLGHRRLSIIDSSGGHQPMHYASGRYVISYNGELYNYKELRSQLQQAGYIFTTQSDTEVIVAAFAAWGNAAFKKFNGMYAFAIYDSVEKQLTLARDASGIKPLYYVHTDAGLSFASEVKALKVSDGSIAENPHWPVYFLAYGHLPEPVTTFKEVRPLEKGACLSYDCVTGHLSKSVFFNFSFIEKYTDHAQVLQSIKDTLSNAVRNHLISDTPIGVFLSGGLDSSIIARLANQHTESLNTVSLYFDNDHFSEKKFQDLLQQSLGCKHDQFLLQESDFHENLPAIIDQMDLPCYDGINTWFISRLARNSGLKAVLSGVGGDELFGGYPSFGRIRIALLLQSSPDFLLQFGRLVDTKKLRRMCYLTIPGAIGRFLFLRGQFIPLEIAKLLDATEQEVWQILKQQPHAPEIDHLTPENQVSWMELNLYMQNQLLRDADVMSMAHGVEIRVPFLDVNVVKLALRISSVLKYKGGHGKQLLIDAFKNDLPESIWNRPKMGFSFPFKEWFCDERYQHVLDTKNTQDAYRKLKQGQIHWSQFYSLLLLKQKL